MNKRIYGEISKTEQLDDGTIKVFGFASSSGVDSDGETITADAMKAALPDYMKFGAVREMHQAKAAGTAIMAEVQDDGRTMFGAHIVDSEAVKKVLAGVYKGFSIGGKVLERDELNKTIIKGIRLVEVSLVDRPANPEAVFTMFKADGIDSEGGSLDATSAVDELAKMLDAGAITPEKLLALAKGEAVIEGKPVAGAEAGSGQATSDDSATIEKGAKVDGLRVLFLGNDVLAKGMYDVQRFAEVLQGISSVASGSYYDAEYEKDGSPIPAQLRDWLATGVGIFAAMAKEEADELVSRLKEMAGEGVEEGDDKSAAATGDDLSKAGARYSAETKASLGELHKKVKACSDHLDKMGYKDAPAAKAEGSDDLSKVAGELDVAKGELTKAQGELSKLQGERDELQKRIKELEAKPSQGKAFLKAIGKGDDVSDATASTAVEAVKKADGSIDEVSTLIKMQHASGGKSIIG